eukprot:9675621-Alexandrium_andersonii.AAC.1
MSGAALIWATDHGADLDPPIIMSNTSLGMTTRKHSTITITTVALVTCSDTKLRGNSLKFSLRRQLHTEQYPNMQNNTTLKGNT